MKKVFKKGWAGIGFLMMLLLASPAVAWEAGESLRIIAWCTDEADEAYMKTFTAALMEGGGKRYVEFMADAEVPCLDLRVSPQQNLNYITVRLTEKMWGFAMSNGMKFEMWKIEDRRGANGFTWLRVQIPGQPT